MVDREAPEKFVVLPPAMGRFRIESDVIVRYARNEWIVISRERAFEGEIAQLGFRGAESVVSFDVTVLESGPTIVGNLVRHRLRLDVPDPAPRWIPGKCAATAVLTRDHKVRLTAFSMVGCVLESDWHIPSRSCGHLRVSLGGIDFVGKLEVAVSRPCGAGSACELIARFGANDSAARLSRSHPEAKRLDTLFRGLTMGNVH